MSVYRITEFTAPDMDKAIEFAETLRGDVAAAGAASIDIVSVDEGKALVIAKYATQAQMDAGAAINKQVFGKMIEAGVVSGDGISMQSGDVIFSF